MAHIESDSSLGVRVERSTPTASWPAIFAGAFVATAATLILLALGSGLGFASVSPWEGRGVSATTFTVTMAIWLIVTQWVSAGLGGYIAGRLRHRWTGTHPHEVFFRDTAHGLVTWAVATVLISAAVATALTSAVGSTLHGASDVVSTGVSAGAQMSGLKASGSASSELTSAYGIDRLFRPATAAGGQSTPQPAATDADARAQVTRILVNAAATGSLPDADRSYLVDLVAARAGIPADEAQKRVAELTANANEAEAKLKAAADAARKAAAEASIYTALSLLVGAFIASVSAALGGRLRDEQL